MLDQSKTPEYANLAYRNNDGEAALMFCFTAGNKFTHQVDKAVRGWNGKPYLKILSDPAIKPGLKGALYLEQLKARGATQVHPLPEALAALQAIRKLTATARAGDLSHDGETVAEDEATKWAAANLAPQLKALRDELSKPIEDRTKTKLLALLNRLKVADAQAAGRELSLSTEEVASCARRNPMHFGLLEGPPLVLFEAVEGSEAEAGHA
jgi:hypothetical protein